MLSLLLDGCICAFDRTLAWLSSKIKGDSQTQNANRPANSIHDVDSLLEFCGVIDSRKGNFRNWQVEKIAEWFPAATSRDIDDEEFFRWHDAFDILDVLKVALDDVLLCPDVVKAAFTNYFRSLQKQNKQTNKKLYGRTDEKGDNQGITQAKFQSKSSP